MLSPASFRPPSVPLVAHDPYFSIWSPADRATDVETVHWTGAQHPLRVQVTVDGEVFRLLGSLPNSVKPLTQVALEVSPTTTRYRFAEPGFEADLAFVTPSLPADLDLLSRPVTYLVVGLRSLDGRRREVKWHVQAGAQIAVHESNQEVEASTGSVEELAIARVGTTEQPVLGRRGDFVRIDWGHLLLASASRSAENMSVSRAHGQAADVELRFDFRPIRVGSRRAERMAMIAYDDEFSIQYFEENLRPYWRRNGANAHSMLRQAATEFPAVRRRCEQFDREIMRDLRRVGGERFALVCALAYRQTLAGNKLVADGKGAPVLFPKENTSNGCIATTDVIYPMSPLFLLFGPNLTKAMLVPVLEYASSGRWPFPFAPHDLGTYPHANGQVYGGGETSEENQMPVEESANMLILLAALAHMEGNAHFAEAYWPAISKWAGYLRDKGYDPENQLCTDDFLGHLARNVNLSAKATMGIASFAKLCRLKGDAETADQYHALAQEFARRWIAEASDGTHFRLTFDRPGTWSQKYNLVWDKILGFGLFPDSVRAMETRKYRSVANPFGVPLDSRGPGAKTDWSVWTASLSRNREDFDAIFDPLYRFVNETPQRVGLGDWYDTSNGNHLFMHSRPVVGGVFIEMLYSPRLWSKWANRDREPIRRWASVPPRPTVSTVVPAADAAPAQWRYSLDDPGPGWTDPAFNDASWDTGLSGFGTVGTPGALVNTVWNTNAIWLRKQFELPAEGLEQLALWIHHDDHAEVYINGVLACRLTGWTTRYETRKLTELSIRALKPGRNTVAVRCRQDAGGQYIDLGFVRVSNSK